MDEKTTGKDFIISFLVALVFKSWWLLIAIVLIVLHSILPVIPMFTVYIALGAWVLSALIHALLIFWGNKSQDMDTPDCRTTSSRLRAKAEAERKAAEESEQGK